jgi:hypothetical protein
MRRISWLAAKTGQLLKKDSAPWSITARLKKKLIIFGFGILYNFS